MKQNPVKPKAAYCLSFIGILLIIHLFSTNARAAEQKGTAKITVRGTGTSKVDSVRIKIWDDYTGGAFSLATTQTVSLRNNKPGNFNLPAFRKQGSISVSLFYGIKVIDCAMVPIANGDQVEIGIDGEQLLFSGKGAKKMQLTYDLYKIHDGYKKPYYDAKGAAKDPRYPAGTLWGSTFQFLNQPLDSLLDEKLKYLDHNRENLSENDYQWVKANTICFDYFVRVNSFLKNKSFAVSADSTKNILFKELYDKKLKSLYPQNIPDSILLKTTWFIDFLIDKWSADRKFNDGFSNEHKEPIAFAASLSPEIRPYFMTTYLLVRRINKLDSSFIDKALKFVNSPFYLSTFNSLRNNVAIGGPAYNFILESNKGKAVKLNDFKGKVVFIDFWFTGCVWCKRYYAETLKEVEEHFKNSKEIVFMSVSIDVNKQSWINSVNEGVYGSAENFNCYTQGKGMDHPLIKYYNVTGYPFQVIVDRDMKNYSVNTVRTLSSKQLIRYLQNAISKSTGSL